MKELENMLNNDNKRKKIENVVYGRLNDILDFHLIENFKVNETTIKEHLNNFNNYKKLNDEKISDLIEIIKQLNEDLDIKINILKLELQETISEIIKGKVV